MKRIVYLITSEMYFCESRNLYFEGLVLLFLNLYFCYKFEFNSDFIES